MSKKYVTLLILTGILLSCLTAAIAIPSLAADDRYIAPAFVVDFNDKTNVTKSFDSHAVTGVHDADEQAMKMLFADTENGACDDPYMNLALPDGIIDIAKYHYMALLIKTDYTGAQGEMRLRSGSTGNNYPFFRFDYAVTIPELVE